jgi:hypothetical protein
MLGDDGQDQVLVTDGGKWDEIDPIDEVIGQISGDLYSQAGFANPTSTRQSEEANVRTLQEATDRRLLLLPPNEGGQWYRKGGGRDGVAVPVAWELLDPRCLV